MAFELIKLCVICKNWMHYSVDKLYVVFVCFTILLYLESRCNDFYVLISCVENEDLLSQSIIFSKMGHSFPTTPSSLHVKQIFYLRVSAKICFSALSSHFSAFCLRRETSDSWQEKLSLEVFKNLRKMAPARSLRVLRFMSSTNCEKIFSLESVIWDLSLGSFWWKWIKVTRFLPLTNIVSKLVIWLQKGKRSKVASETVILHQNCLQFLKFHLCVELFTFLFINL